MKGYGYIRERQREPEPSAKPQITSFADVTLVLLVIFLVSAAAAVEMFAAAFGTAAPLTRDFINIGMASYYGDTTRMKAELVPELAFPTLRDGLPLL